MAEAAREMTPDELFEKARSHRLTSLTPPPPGDDVVMLSLMADERAHRRADAKLDRLIGMVKCEATQAGWERPEEAVGDIHRGVVYLLGVITGGLGVLVLRLLGV